MYKSTGDVESGKKMYDYYSDVHDRDEPHFLSLRSIVLARKQPRKMFVQHNTVLKGKLLNPFEYKKKETSAKMDPPFEHFGQWTIISNPKPNKWCKVFQYSFAIFMPPFIEGGTYCFAHFRSILWHKSRNFFWLELSFICLFIPPHVLQGSFGDTHCLNTCSSQNACFVSYLHYYRCVLLQVIMSSCWNTTPVRAAVVEWFSSWLAEQEDRGSIPGLATWIFRVFPACKLRYGWKIAKSTLILKTTYNQRLQSGGCRPVLCRLISGSHSSLTNHRYYVFCCSW